MNHPPSHYPPDQLARLRHRFPQLPEDEVIDAWTDALEDHGYSDCAASSPGMYVAAWRNARDRSASCRSRYMRESNWATTLPQVAPSPPDNAVDVDLAINQIMTLLKDAMMLRTFVEVARRDADYLKIGRACSDRPVDDATATLMGRRQKNRLMKFLRRNRRVRQLVERHLK